MDTNKKNRFVNMLLLTACALLAVVSVFFPLALIVLPGFIAATIAKNEKPALAAGFSILCPILALAVLYGLNDSLLCALPLAVLASVGGTLIYYLQKKKIGGFYTVVCTSLLMGGMLYLFIALPGVLSGVGAFTYIKNTLTQLVEMLADFLTANIDNFSDPESIPELIETYRTFPSLLVSLIVPSCCGIAGFLALGNFLFFRLFVKKRREELGLNPISPFRMWRVPTDYIFGVFIAVVATLVLELTGSEAAYSCLSTFAMMLDIPLAIQGVCLIDWFLVKRCKPEKLKRRRILIYTLIGLLFQLLSTFLAIFGMTEVFFHFRERIIIIQRPGGKGGSSNPFNPRTPKDGGSDSKEKREDNPEDKHSEEK